MRMMNNVSKSLPYIKDYIPCTLNCNCIRTLNLKDSYADKYIYKRCYMNQMKFTNSYTNDYLRRLIREKKI